MELVKVYEKNHALYIYICINVYILYMLISNKQEMVIIQLINKSPKKIHYCVPLKYFPRGIAPQVKQTVSVNFYKLNLYANIICINFNFY